MSTVAKQLLPLLGFLLAVVRFGFLLAPLEAQDEFVTVEPPDEHASEPHVHGIAGCHHVPNPAIPVGSSAALFDYLNPDPPFPHYLFFGPPVESGFLPLDGAPPPTLSVCSADGGDVGDAPSRDDATTTTDRERLDQDPVDISDMEAENQFGLMFAEFFDRLSVDEAALADQIRQREENSVRFGGCGSPLTPPSQTIGNEATPGDDGSASPEESQGKRAKNVQVADSTFNNLWMGFGSIVGVDKAFMTGKYGSLKTTTFEQENVPGAGVPGGKNETYTGLKEGQVVGSGGAEGCVVVIVTEPNGTVRVAHFTATDDVDATLRDMGPFPEGSKAAIAGGSDKGDYKTSSEFTMELVDEYFDGDPNVKVQGYADSSGLFVDEHGNFFVPAGP